MVNQSELGQKRISVFRTSSSIANWKEKLKKRIKLKEWTLKDIFKSTLFIGNYHIGDYIRILLHQGEKRIFWCGSDILNLQKSIWRYIIPRLKIRHFCENYVEYKALKKMGIESEITPMIFDDPDKYKPCYKKGSHAWLCYRKGYEKEYGVAEAIKLCKKKGWKLHIYDGSIPEKQFNKEIRDYQIVLRLNKFDGFSEALAKGILLGQRFVSTIKYPKGEKYWRKRFDESLKIILS